MGKKKNGFFKFLDILEVTGNKMPHPITLFFGLAVFVVLISALGEQLGWSATGEILNRSSGVVEIQTIKVKSLLNAEGFVYFLTSMVSNFVNFAPLGIVLVITFGIGLSEESGYIGALVKTTVSKTPAFWITPVVVFLGVMSNVASVVGYVILIPLGGIIFLSYKKHPLAGMAAAFAGCSGGFSANLLIGPIDPLLSGITDQAAKIIDPNFLVNPTCNWYFMIASTILITIVGTYVTEKIVIPHLGHYDPQDAEMSVSEMELKDISELEKKALLYANVTTLLLLVGLIVLAMPQNSIFRNPANGSLVSGSPLMAGIIPIVTIIFFIPALVYGKIVKKFNNSKDIAVQMGKSMASMGPYLALVFVAAQFIAFFEKTQLGMIIALNGATWLQALSIPLPILMALFVLLCAFLNIFLASASAKWVILAPVFVPLLMRLGVSPALTQVAFRIGDSSTNIITPLMDYFPLILVFAQKYDKKIGIGTMISTMVPYSIAFLVFWIILLIVWMLLGLPVGPGATPFM